jgi:hypothetical protein
VKAEKPSGFTSRTLELEITASGAKNIEVFNFSNTGLAFLNFSLAIFL